eukprot:TRINITY_DN16529_c0_g1_i1.p1 TRINITY_DN16529_c0_g1~~TRINITY_DN16529_c0_g1_i1.p1  ORF type:complete len:427 (-),score=43.25 TRINITY_DN16529_c0_g1_i1:3-1226(-)
MASTQMNNGETSGEVATAGHGTFSKLSPDELHVVCTFLPLASVSAIMLVCRAFKQAAAADQIWEPLARKHFPDLVVVAAWRNAFIDKKMPPPAPPLVLGRDAMVIPLILVLHSVDVGSDWAVTHRLSRLGHTRWFIASLLSLHLGPTVMSVMEIFPRERLLRRHVVLRVLVNLLQLRVPVESGEWMFYTFRRCCQTGKRVKLDPNNNMRPANAEAVYFVQTIDAIFESMPQAVLQLVHGLIYDDLASSPVAAGSLCFSFVSVAFLLASQNTGHGVWPAFWSFWCFLFASFGRCAAYAACAAGFGWWAAGFLIPVAMGSYFLEHGPKAARCFMAFCHLFIPLTPHVHSPVYRKRCMWPTVASYLITLLTAFWHPEVLPPWLASAQLLATLGCVATMLLLWHRHWFLLR